MKTKVIQNIIAVILVLMIAGGAFAAGFYTRKCSQDKSLSSLEWALETIEKYYYFGGVQDGFGGAAISGIADVYLDRYSEYYTKEEYEALYKSNTGAKSGIGVSYTFVEDGYADISGVFIATVMGNSPAYRSGLRAGEFLTEGIVGTKSVTFNDADDFGDLISGARDGESITLKNGYGESFTVAKAEYTASYTYLATRDTAWVFKDAAYGGLAMYEEPSESIDFLPEGTAYIYLSQFFGTAPQEFFRLVQKFNAMHCTHLILDLRSDGGGYVNVMQEIAGAFADGEEKLAMVSRDKRGDSENFYCSKMTDVAKRISKDVKVSVLANSGTASASEALIGAMYCYGALKYEDIYLSDYSDGYLGWLKKHGGETKTCRTYGKGIMQSTFVNYSTGEALKLTTAKIFWPDGKTTIHDRGVTDKDGCKTVKADWEFTLRYKETNGKMQRLNGDKELLAAVEMMKQAA